MATMRRINSCLVVLPCLLLSWFFCVGIFHAADTLRAGEVMTDGDFLESSGQSFRLQFFSPGSSKNRYVGIKYMDYNGFTVWPANLENPLNDSSGILSLTQDGNLVITDDWGTSVTINSEQPAKSTNTSLTLLDSGNLVLRDGEQIVWQSFDHPSDTLLPGVKLGWFDLKTGRPRGRFLTSWTSPEVLAPGAFKLGVDPNNTKQLVVWRRGVPYWRSGTWNGYKFSYLPDTQLSEAFSHWNFSYSSNENERYFTFTVSNNIFGWIEMQAFGHINQFVYTERAQTVYKQSSCDDDKMETRSKGCVSPEPSRCRGGDVFTQKTGFMNGSEYLYNFSLGLSDCREICTRNCSCDAYATALSDGTACRFSRGQTFYYGGEEVFYVRNKTAADKDTLRAGEVMRDGEFLESSGRRFQLQFFSPGSSKNRYLGIKFMDYNGFTVWAANLENPLNDSSGILNLTQDGNLVITDDWGTSVTMNSEQPAKSTNTSLTLLDSGNLILRDREQIVWQSFDYPSSTLLPGMKLGWFDLKTGRLRSRFLNSWTSPEVLALGTFKLGVDPNNTKQLVVWRRGVPYWHSGNWNGYNFTYLPNTELKGAFSQWNFSYFSNENESYFILTMSNNIFGWIEMQAFGQINQFIYTERAETVYTQSSCDNELETWSKGCVMPEPSRCRGGDVFTQKTGFLNGSEYLYNFSLGLSDCREICRRNCSCNAYASAQSDGTACKFSLGQMFYSGGEEFFYVRNDTVADKDRSRKRQLWLTVGAPVASLLIIVLVSIFCYLQGSHFCFGGKNASSQYVIRQEMSHRAGTSIAGIDELSGSPELDLSGKKGHELPLFNFSSIEIATDYFSNANKLGQGGFGPVYKGMLVKGQEIAVKRLSKSSKQGVEEFKNEVLLISKLQHRNLVRLLGCCIEGEERILIYEYLPNNSLDSFLFDAAKRGFLDWKRRVCIIEGIAQGLLYLHKYSRLRIIHRDLKTSNILLDHDMNPKISDFGTARIFEGNESQANTNRIVGTYGYMSPEYAMDGLFSEKSDVFSFGVMMLEIISGKKNTGFYESDRTLNLLGYVWDLYRDGRCLEVIDPAVEETCSRNEVMRCLQVGLLCVQESAVDRPTMSNVVSMLSNESMTLPAPKQPGFSNIVSGKDATLPEYEIPCSVNDATISEIVAR